MRPIILATLIALGLSVPSAAQTVVPGTMTFPEPGTFCGPFTLCTPEPVTRGG